MANVSTDRIAEIKARLAAASCGVFFVIDDEDPDRFVIKAADADAEHVLARADLDMLGNASADLEFLLDAVTSLRTALANLVEAVAPEQDAGEICPVCLCTMPEFDEPHASDCAYLVARQLLGLPEMGLQFPADDEALAQDAALPERVVPMSEEVTA